MNVQTNLPLSLGYVMFIKGRERLAKAMHSLSYGNLGVSTTLPQTTY